MKKTTQTTLKRRISDWLWQRKMNVAVPVPMWVIHAITDTHIRNVEDDVQWSLMIGATPSGYDVERYGNAMAELRRIFVRKAFNR